MISKLAHSQRFQNVMPPKNPQQEVSNSGITTGPDGQRVVAASVRADGSVRKEIKIRPGYQPPEDVAAYKNRTAEAFRNRGKGGVPGAEARDDAKDDSKDSGGASNKNAKRREARRRAKEKDKGEPDQSAPAPAVPEQVKPEENGNKGEESLDLEAEKEREAKKLTKKLRQARELKERTEKGDSLLPEQLQKVIRINELIRQLDVLGYDANGERKGASEDP
jgi:partner of Y14 and mago protein